MVYFLFLLIFTEGYVILATELLAIRLMVPMVGSATDTVAVIIAGVLMPLAFGYHAGGNYRVRLPSGKRRASVRQKLLRNITISGFILSLGLSTLVIDQLFAMIETLGIYNRILETAIYAAIFIVYPIFLLGQTIPLASNFFTQKTLSQLTGRMLSFSTFGSFTGSILTTLILMTYFGVHNTVIVNIALLMILVVFLARRDQRFFRFSAVAIFALAFILNNNLVTGLQGIVSDNSYSTVKVASMKDDPEKSRVLIVNNGFFSAYSSDKGVIFDYVKYINKHFIDPIATTKEKPRDILILGGGGFTIGVNDLKNNYTYIDINPDIKDISEEYLLRKKVTDNKKFIAEDARAYIRQNKKKYDLIVLDAYTAIKVLPQYLVTQEYFLSVRNALKNNGIVAMNFIVCPGFNDLFSLRLDNTLRSVFPQMNRTVVYPTDFSAWKNYENEAGDCAANIIYSATLHPQTLTDKTIYTDNRNTAFLDKGRHP